MSKKAIEAAVEAVEAASAPPVTGPIEVTLASGIRLRIKRVPATLLMQVVSRFPRPEPPKVENKDKGVVEPNEADPNYRLELTRWESEIGQASIDAILTVGCDVIHVPEGLYGPDSEEWAEIQETLQLDVPKGPIARKMAWLRLYALADSGDYEKVLNATTTLMGVSESEVAAAALSFRRGAVRPADRDVSVAGNPNGRNSAPRAAAPSLGAGVEGSGEV